MVLIRALVWAANACAALWVAPLGAVLRAGRALLRMGR
ncbi:hypothetical protein P3T39_000730 [Kitasatospora sp. GP82]|nr:hypothetical protein [Kitasatospora sp. GP82]